MSHKGNDDILETVLDYMIEHGVDHECALDCIEFELELKLKKIKQCIKELQGEMEWPEEEVDPNAPDLKTHIPGLGFIVTNLGSGETHIFPEDE